MDLKLDGMFERLVADRADGGGHGGGIPTFDMGALGRQIDTRPAHARHGGDRAFDPAHAARAGHAEHGQFEGVDGGSFGHRRVPSSDAQLK